MQATKVAAKETKREAAHILVVDDEKSLCELLEITFRKDGHRVEGANGLEAARRKLEGSLFDIVISDIRMPGGTGLELLRFTKEIARDSFFLLMTALPDLDTAVDALNSGADRFVIKDHNYVEQLRRAVGEVSESLKWKKEAGYLRRELRRLTGLDNIIGQSPKMKAIFDMIQTVAPQNSRVLITGESGTGKKLAATNKDLEKAIAAGEFREDLFYRLSVIPIHVPSLRERRDDIPLLARHFLEQFRKSMEKPIQGISPEAMSLLESYDWPGNVRELENTIERAVALETGAEISARVLPERVNGISPAVGASLSQAAEVRIPAEGIDFDQVVAGTERRYLQAALAKADGVRTEAAQILKISYRSFRHYAKKHNL